MHFDGYGGAKMSIVFFCGLKEKPKRFFFFQNVEEENPKHQLELTIIHVSVTKSE